MVADIDAAEQEKRELTAVVDRVTALLTYSTHLVDASAITTIVCRRSPEISPLPAVRSSRQNSRSIVGCIEQMLVGTLVVYRASNYRVGRTLLSLALSLTLTCPVTLAPWRYCLRDERAAGAGESCGRNRQPSHRTPSHKRCPGRRGSTLGAGAFQTNAIQDRPLTRRRPRCDGRLNWSYRPRCSACSIHSRAG